jgi:hypothetical protein
MLHVEVSHDAGKGGNPWQPHPCGHKMKCRVVVTCLLRSAVCQGSSCDSSCSVSYTGMLVNRETTSELTNMSVPSRLIDCSS